MRTAGALLAITMWCVCANVPSYAEERKGVLDGFTFIGETGKLGQEKGEPEEVAFRDGRLHSKASVVHGFGEAVYTTTMKDDSILFEAETVSPTEGTITWRGVVKDNRLDGIFSWHKAPRWYRLWPSSTDYWVKALAVK